MNLGIKAPQKEEVKILDYKTDKNGSALYQIQWISRNNLVTWEPLHSIKQHYSKILEFER